MSTPQIVYIPLTKIIRCRWREEEDSPEKWQAAYDRISVQGWQALLVGRVLPDGFVEQLTGHNRVGMLLAHPELGITEIPFLLPALTDNEACDIFMTNNLAVDGQNTGWILGVVRTRVPELLATGVSEGLAFAEIAKTAQLPVKVVAALQAMLAPLRDGRLSPQIKRISPPVVSVEFWKWVNKLAKLSGDAVSFSDQDEKIERVLRGTNNSVEFVRSMWRPAMDAAKLAQAQPLPPVITIAPPSKTTDDDLRTLNNHMAKTIKRIQAQENPIADPASIKTLRENWQCLNAIFTEAEEDNDVEATTEV